MIEEFLIIGGFVGFILRIFFVTDEIMPLKEFLWKYGVGMLIGIQIILMRIG